MRWNHFAFRECRRSTHDKSSAQHACLLASEAERAGERAFHLIRFNG